jgi:hypothetical protein
MVLIGDGVKEAKEGLRMPGVKKMHQESGDSSKREYIMGHLFGALGIIVGNAGKQFCLPITMTIQDGCKPILEWMKSDYAEGSHVTCLVRQACKAAAMLVEKARLIMDAYFLSEPALITMREEAEKAGKDYITLITKARKNYVANEKPGKYKGRGRPEIIGKEVSLFGLFETMAESFVTKELIIYGKLTEVQYYCVNLLWGRHLHQELRFVLTSYSGHKSILASTDLTLLPEAIIQLYCYRFKIETFFRAFKQSIAGFGYHFWTYSMPLLNPFEHAKETVEKLARITDTEIRNKIIDTYKATEGFVMFCCIATGILQLCALQFTKEINLSPVRWLRTYTNTVPSEESTAAALRDSFKKLFNKYPKLHIAEIVAAKMDGEDCSFDASA